MLLFTESPTKGFLRNSDGIKRAGVLIGGSGLLPCVDLDVGAGPIVSG